MSGVPFPQGAFHPSWQHLAYSSFRSQTGKPEHREVKGWLTRRLAGRFSTILAVYILDREWGLEEVPRAHPGLLGRVTMVSRPWDPVEERAWEQSASSGTSCVHT